MTLAPARIPGRSLASQGLALPPVLGAASATAVPDPNLTDDLSRILRPQAAYRWLLPSLAAITPQYIEMTLRGALAGNHVQAWELFDLMQDTWPRLSKNIQQVTDAVVGMNWQLMPYQEEDEDISDAANERRKVVAAAVRAMRPDVCADENGFDDTIRDLCDGWFKGQVVLETQWHQPQAGKLGQIVAPRSTFWVHPVCYAWDMNGRLGLRNELGALRDQTRTAQRTDSGVAPSVWNSTTYQPRPTQISEFPPHKFLIGLHKAKAGTALGGALLRPLAWWWCAANFSADWLLNLAQIFGLPFRWAHYAAGTPQGTIDAICSMLQNMGSAGWAAFPEGAQLEFKEAGASGDNSPQGDLLDRADKNCDLLILRQTLTTDVSASGGSRALGSVHETVEEKLCMSVARYVAGALNQQLIPSILTLNFGDTEDAPHYLPAPDTGDDLQQMAGVITQLNAAGFGSRIGLDWLGKKFNIPKPSEQEETLSAPQEEEEPTEAPEGKGKEDLAAKAAPEPSASERFAAELEPIAARLTQRLEAIGKIEDPLLMQDRLRAFSADLDGLKGYLAHDPVGAETIYQTLLKGFVEGTIQATKEAKA